MSCERVVYQKAYRKCFVPDCFNSSSNSGKIFIHVPQDPVRRQLWFKAVKGPRFYNPKGVFFCCEDHFNVSYFFGSFNKTLFYFIKRLTFVKYVSNVIFINHHFLFFFF